MVLEKLSFTLIWIHFRWSSLSVSVILQNKLSCRLLSSKTYLSMIPLIFFFLRFWSCGVLMECHNITCTITCTVHCKFDLLSVRWTYWLQHGVLYVQRATRFRALHCVVHLNYDLLRAQCTTQYGTVSTTICYDDFSGSTVAKKKKNV